MENSVNNSVPEQNSISASPPAGGVKSTLPIRTIVLIAVLFIVVVILLLITFARNTQKPVQPPAMQTAVTKPKVIAASTIYILPNPLFIPANVATGQNSVLMNVNINTGSNKVSGVQLEMQYDPKVISNVKLSPGTFFPNPNILINKVDPVKGTATYAIAGQLGSNAGQSGIGPIAAIQFSILGKAGDSTSFLLLPTTVVTSSGVSSSVLKSVVGTHITIAPSSTPTVAGISGTPSGQALPLK